MSRRPISLIRTVNKCLSGTVYIDTRSKAVAPKSRLLRLTGLPVRRLFCALQTEVDHAIAMQPVRKAAAAAARGEREARAQQDRDPVASPRGGRVVTKDGSTVREDPSTDSKKVKKKKKKPRKVGVRGRKVEQSQSILHLLAELPFANTDVCTELGFSGTQESKKRAQGGQVEREDRPKDKKNKREFPRPNYFVSIPITNQQIKQGVEEVQAFVLEKEARLSRALIPPATLHVTLLVTHLATQEEVQTAALAMEEMDSTLKSLLGGRRLLLPFRGIGHFRQEVAFVQVEEGEHLNTLTQIADLVRRAFEEKGIPSGDRKAFTPHLTFIKLSRAPKLRHQGIKKLDPALYTPFDQHVFGEERVCSLELCSMLKKKSADGYYHRERTVTFALSAQTYCPLPPHCIHSQCIIMGAETLLKFERNLEMAGVQFALDCEDLLQIKPHSARKSAKPGPELDDEELLSLSKRLVEDAVSRAVCQYMEEMQRNGVANKNEAPPLSRPPAATTK